MELREILARNVRRRRRALGLSQEELAHRAGIDRTYVSHIERSIHAVTIDVLDQLGLALDVAPGDLLRSKP
jgi:transcriptional regulator with XRE-family HTH domain